MTPNEPPADRKARVLIVDDERKNRDLLESMLVEEDLLFEMAESGEEALATVAKQQPDLILLDVLMPGMGGLEATRRLKSDPATWNIPVIIVTAVDDRAARMAGLSAGAEDFLSKPVERAELRVRVKNLLRLSAAVREAREARLMAEHSNSAKTLFLRAMSHELRTPLNAISGYTELIQLGIRGPVTDQQLTDLGRIKRASDYLLSLINDVLTVARLEGARPMTLEPVPVNALLEEVEGLCTLQAKAKGVQLRAMPSTCQSVVLADPERLQQILLNLITNAIKFTASEGSVSVTCAGEGESVRILVADTGMGIRPIDLERVFEPFVQLNPHLTIESQQGIGLGLSISRQLARSMNGDLTLASIEGAGSTFTLTLPRAAAAAATSSSSRRLESAGSSAS